MIRQSLLGLAALVLAAGCTTQSGTGPQAPTAAAILDESVPEVAREACLREVRRTTNNTELVILEMISSQANSQVKVGVGPDRAPWRCLVSNSGVVAEVMSLTDEGAL